VVVNSGASRSNSSFFPKLSTAGVLPAKNGQEEREKTAIQEAVVYDIKTKNRRNSEKVPLSKGIADFK